MRTQQIAIVTGGNRGIGLSIARELARRPHTTVVITARDAKQGEEAVAELKGEGLEATFHPLDIGSDDSVAAFANWVGDTYGAVHILVNNAGMGGEPASVDALHTDVATFNDVHNVNVTGALRMIKAFMPAMKKANYGRIVNVSSAAGQFGFMSNSSVAYSASKAGLNALTVMFGKAVEADKDIAVVAMCPGPVRTRMAEEHNGLYESFPKALGHKGWKEPDSIGHEVLHLIDLKKEKANGKFFRDNKLISWI